MATRIDEKQLVAQLDQDGVVVIPNLLNHEQLRGMQKAFEIVLRRMRWNDFDGYEQTEPLRHMVQNVLMLDQGFVDFALHPVVKDVLHEYIGTNFQLVEAKGWKSLPTHEDFHGWHGDAWYDQELVHFIPREVKLALYLTDVTNGAFNYIRGSHRKQTPRPVGNSEVQNVPRSEIVEVPGPAGTAFMFDTSGIHRQAIPVLQPRHAIFYNYHDPSVPLQREDVEYYRYHPLILNAAYLGGLAEDDERILGFGNKTNYVPHFERRSKHAGLQNMVRSAFEHKIRAQRLTGRVVSRVKRTIKLKPK